MKRRIMAVLDGIGIGNGLRFVKRNVREALVAGGFLKWHPLVPQAEFRDRVKDALGELLEHDPAAEIGDYLEFGVSRGTSLAAAFHAYKELGLHHVRFFGFDSFQGMPEEAEGQGWKPGQYRSTVGATVRYLSSRGVDMKRVTLTKGWFRDTLTAETRARMGVTSASVIMVDCDIYTASREALDFAQSYIKERAVVIFDDWGWREDVGEIGQKEAFDEFRAAHPEFEVTALRSYLKQARVFLLERASR
jgi:O-methyltransferase